MVIFVYKNKSLTTTLYDYIYYALLFSFPIFGIICKTASNNSKSVCYYYNLARL